MSTVPCANYRRNFTTERVVGDKTEKITYELNTTARKVDSMTIDEMNTLIVKTTKLWLYIAKAIELGKRELPEEIAFKSAEMAMENDGETELVQHNEPRVTVFDWNHQIELTLHSSSLPQPTLELWYSMDDAQKELDKLYPRKTPPNVIQDAPPQGATQSQAQFDALPSQKPATPKNTPPAPNTAPHPQGDSMPLYTKKDAIAKLAAGDKFRMKIVQIEKHSKDGADYFEFFEPYGGKAGQFSAVSVFVDNEVAINNGLIGYLSTLNVSMKIPLVGEWVLNCVMGKPKTKTVKGEERTFTSIYVNSFEGQIDDDPNQNLSDEIPWGEPNF